MKSYLMDHFFPHYRKLSAEVSEITKKNEDVKEAAPQILLEREKKHFDEP